MPQLTILGVAPADTAAALGATLARIDGPELVLERAGRIVGVAQHAAPQRRLAGLLAGRDKQPTEVGPVCRRLEAACRIAPFLPAAPGARLPAEAWGQALAAASPGLAEALVREGDRHQWELVLRWTPDAVLARERNAILEAARDAAPSANGRAEAQAHALRLDRLARLADLRSVLAPVVLAVAEIAGDGPCELRLQLLVPRNGEALVEQALGRLSPRAGHTAEADLRGPLPPLAFAPVEVRETSRRMIEAAWSTLGLGAAVDAASLGRAWTDAARRLGSATEGSTIEAAREAHALLGGLIGAGACSRDRALLRAGWQLVPPRPPLGDRLGQAA